MCRLLSVLQKVSFNFVWKQDQNQKNDTNAEKKRKYRKGKKRKYRNYLIELRVVIAKFDVN